MHPKALQHDPHNIFVEREGLGLEKFNESEEDASYKIQSYFEGMGFEIIPGIPDLLFFNTAMRNISFMLSKSIY